MSYEATKIVGYIITVSLYLLGMKRRRIGAPEILLGTLFFLICFPLGFDTLAYKWFIEEQRLERFGLLWTSLGRVHVITGLWWAIYFIVYPILVTGFYRLSNRSQNPSLTFAMLVTLPCLGFSYLSVVRQALAVGLVIHGIIAIRNKSAFAGLFLMLVGCLAHISCLMWVSMYMFWHVFSLRRIVKGRVVYLITILVALIIFNSSSDIVERLRIDVLINGYLLQNSDKESGMKLTFFWCCLGGMAILINHFGNTQAVNWLVTCRILLVCTIYSMVFYIYGEAVRLIWYILPILVSDLAGQFQFDKKHGFRLNIVRFLTIMGICIAALNPISRSPDYFWANQYPFEWLNYD
jgi:hypothetical protein